MDFSNKTSLFDLVSMIIPGYTLIFSLAGILNKTDCIKTNDIVYLAPILAVSYIVGKLIHHLSRLIFDHIFRDDTELMEITRKEVYEKRYGKNCTILSIEEKNIINTFYDKYYKAIDRYKHTNIRILEAQFSFVRSMTIVLPFVLAKIIIVIDKEDMFFPACCLTILLATTIIIKDEIKNEKEEALEDTKRIGMWTTIGIIAGIAIGIIAGATIGIIIGATIGVGVGAVVGGEKAVKAVITFMEKATNKETQTKEIIQTPIKKKKKREEREIIFVRIILSIIYINILTFITIKAYYHQFAFFAETITITSTINFIIIYWILPTINRQIYKSVWEDELYTRDLDK